MPRKKKTETILPDHPLTNRLLRIEKSHNLTEKQMSFYLGVPLTTYIKWKDGTRTPNSCLFRLLDVLDYMEIMTPELHKIIIKEVKNE